MCKMSFVLVNFTGVELFAKCLHDANMQLWKPKQYYFDMSEVERELYSK